MKSLNALIPNLASKYASQGVDIKIALEAWKEAKLSPEQIREQVMEDIREKVSAEDGHILFNASRNKEMVQAEYDAYNKYANARYIKVTPAVKSALEKVDNNLYRLKTAGVDITWSIEMKEGKPWLKRMSTRLPDSIEEESLKSSSAQSRVKFASEEIEPWEIHYWACGLSDRFLEEYPGVLPEELRGIFKKLEGLQQGAIRESDFLLGILDIAEEHKDAIKDLRAKSDEEFEKRKKLRDMYEKGDKPEYYRGAADNSIKKDKKEEDYKHTDAIEDTELDEFNDFDLDFLI